MKKKWLLLFGLVFTCLTCKSQTLDKYGGLDSVKCASATGWFHAEKIGKRWWLCTPLGHAYFFQGVGGFSVPARSKYNNIADTAAAELVDEVQSWGFNGIGELSDRLVEPIGQCRGCTKLPVIQTFNVSNYSAANLWNFAQRPMKNLMWGINGNYVGWRASLMDFFEPQFGPWLDGYFANDQGFLGYKSSAYLVGVMLDDTDWFWGMGAGPDFHTVPPGHTNAHTGYMVLITSPVQTFNPDPASRGIPELYADTKVYSKTAMASPPATCSIATPCSLRDYLYKKYNGSIAALNAAWGSNYTTFDSTGTPVTGELIGTGDGATKVFAHKSAKTPVSAHSVAIGVAGKAQAGDCPGCGLQSGGAIMGPAGAAVATGIQPWLRDSQVTVQNCGGPDCSLPPASYWVRTAWHGCLSTPSRTIGNTYRSGNPQITVSTNNGTAPPRCATGVDVYVSCRLQFSSAPSHGCLGEASGNPEPAETLQASDVPLNDGHWTEPSSGLVSGAALPSPPSFIDYSKGEIQITFSSAPKAGQRITADYVANGWEYGTGLMDEDGHHKEWTGTNSVCLSSATACDGREEPKANANPRLAEDLDAWVAQFAAQYFRTLSKHLKAAAPHMLYFGADTVGTWGAPPRKEILQGAGPYVDGVFTQWNGTLPDPAKATAMNTYLTKYLGDKPLMNFITMCANPDSAMSGSGQADCFATQAARGQQWYSIISSMLNTRSFSDTYQWVGIVWWGSHDFSGANGEYTNWGLKTPSDNAYDGHEDVATIVPCSPPLEKYTCGGEKRDYGDAVTWLKKANHLWLELATSKP